ncbi:PDZ domain-containing protein [Rhodococcus fascians]|jgi:PDZ domain-containing protein|nr:PDZ domain-containing protein [Rhodococcus fascians]MBY3997347.1 PDZ domain-containing protein [Rhodococcus fascians]MBY4003921.1 PDZ domain-containing protein [Rhodococcus fascians]MBY4008482.1 PDZ domain-containing protein [Rhodococcus fascians]MBY4018804.1 PDZ domain-containing protein [Rhodococcus fascians]
MSTRSAKDRHADGEQNGFVASCVGLRQGRYPRRRTFGSSVYRVNRRIATLVAALVPVVVLGVTGSVVTVPFAALGPGPTYNTLGDVDGVPVVQIDGTDVDPTAGHLNMTTVAVRDQLNLFEALGFWASGRQGLVPREEVYPPDKSKEEVQEGNQADFEQSESSAELAALHHLDLPVSLSVTSVAQDGPAAGVLNIGDTLVAVGGTPVSTAGAVREAVSAKAPGDSLDIDYVRDGAPRTGSVVLGARPDDPSKGYLGVTPEEQPDVPFDVKFNLADVGGPSAGLMFSLAVVDKLSPGELSNGEFVAGTGTIDAAGTVGPIGGIPYKLIAAREAGATTFLVPDANCGEAQQNVPDGLRLVRVESLDNAIDSLRAIGSGEDVPTCS